MATVTKKAKARSAVKGAATSTKGAAAKSSRSTAMTKAAAPKAAAAPAKKASAAKGAAAKAGAKKAAPKKAAAKKVVARKVVARKAAARKVVAKKLAARKLAARKVVAKKAAARKAASKKVAATTIGTKKAVAKKAVAKKPAAKKDTTKKAAAKKTAAKTTAGKTTAAKVPAKKIVAGQVSAQTVAPRKTVAPVAAKKTTPKPPASRKAPKRAPLAAAPAPSVQPDAEARAAAPAEEAVDDPLQRLGRVSAEAPLTRGGGAAGDDVAMPDGFFGAYTGAALTDADYQAAATALGCEVAAVKAVAEVETAGAGFDANKRPTLLYERHVFARCTQPPGKFDQAHPDLSGLRNPYPPGGYGTKDQQAGKMARAYQLDAEAALKAPSWGKFQILGENFAACGFASVVEFAKAMTVSEGEHLKAFMSLVRRNASLLAAIRAKNWAGFAKGYNGPNYATFQYDTKLAAAYAKYAG